MTLVESPSHPALSPTELMGAFELFLGASQTLEKKHAELAVQIDTLSADLMHANARLNVLINALPAAVILVEEGLVTHHNDAALLLIGHLQTQTPWLLPVDWETGEGPGEYEISDPKGHKTVQLQENNIGNRTVIQIQDITANLKNVEESERVNRLAAMGKMSAGIAHQLRTPLSTALLYASHLSNADLSAQDRLTFANRLQNQLINLEKLASQMLQFIQTRPLQTQMVGLDALILEACHNIEGVCRERGIDIELHLHADDCMVTVERPIMVSALVGILENAAQVCKAGQRIEITTSFDPLKAQITIEDSGPGIAKDMESSLFEPFATNRVSGTGLGLSMARNTIQSHRGDISYCNRPKGGASFTVSLPCLTRF